MWELFEALETNKNKLFQYPIFSRLIPLPVAAPNRKDVNVNDMSRGNNVVNGLRTVYWVMLGNVRKTCMRAK